MLVDSETMHFDIEFGVRSNLNVSQWLFINTTQCTDLAKHIWIKISLILVAFTCHNSLEMKTYFRGVVKRSTLIMQKNFQL